MSSFFNATIGFNFILIIKINNIQPNTKDEWISVNETTSSLLYAYDYFRIFFIQNIQRFARNIYQTEMYKMGLHPIKYDLCHSFKDAKHVSYIVYSNNRNQMVILWLSSNPIGAAVFHHLLASDAWL